MTTPFRRLSSESRFEASLARTKVFNIIKAKSFFREKIKLASGRESDFYFNMKPTLYSAELEAVAKLVITELPDDIDYVGGLAMGALPLISAVTMVSAQQKKELLGFYVREPKDHGTMLTIEGLAQHETLAGKKVAILDDVTTTGGSAMKAVKEAKEAGAEVIIVLSLVDRGEGAVDFYREREIPFRAIFTASEFMAD
jgi:orotate phosphoribosyltransferase